MNSIVAWEKSMGIKRWKGANGVVYVSSVNWDLTDELMDAEQRARRVWEIDQERLASLEAREGGETK
jgi:hypothetical protein